MCITAVIDLEYVSRVFAGRVAEFCGLVFEHVLRTFGGAKALFRVFSVSVADTILNAVTNAYIVFLAVNRFLSVELAL